MQRLALGEFTAALAVGIAVPAFAAEPPASDSKPWYSRLIGADAKKPDSEKTFAATPARPGVVFGPMEPAVLAEALKAEQTALQRRLDVCLKLRQIAARTNDDKLAEQADELERQATALYHTRTAKLGVKAALRAPEEPKAGAAVSVAAPRPATTDFREVAHD